jgi:hypothetical protein
MGVELHITRAEFWADNESAEISSAEWLNYVASDAELSLADGNGQFYAVWNGLSKYDEPWLNWFNGNVSTKWPDTALFEKMLQVAGALGAKVQDDEGTNYLKVGDWIYDPTHRVEAMPAQEKTKWWQRFWRNT